MTDPDRARLVLRAHPGQPGDNVGILDRDDPRLFIVVGPCSIHDPAAAREYAQRLSGLAAKVDQTMLLVMRVYFEKPRTIVGWKGLINDPRLDGSFDVNEGLKLARKLLVDINEIGMPTGGLWKLRLNTDAGTYSKEFGDYPSFDVEATEPGMDGFGAHATINIAPYTMLIYSQDN